MAGAHRRLRGDAPGALHNQEHPACRSALLERLAAALSTVVIRPPYPRLRGFLESITTALPGCLCAGLMDTLPLASVVLNFRI